MRSVSGSSSAPTFGSAFTSARELVVAADRHHLRSGADGEQHLGNRGDERHDASRRGAGVPALRQRRVEQKDDESDRDERGQLLRTSSHRKNGPPIIAVTTPTGISTGARIVRATRSHATRNAAPKSADAGSTIR